MANEERLEPGKVMQFGRNIQFIGQQRQNRLVPFVDADLAYSEKGDRFTDEFFGLSEPQDSLTDWGDSPDGHIPQYRRIAFPKAYEDGKWVGTRERAEKLIDPTNSVVQAMAFGRERRRDRVIVERGIFAASQFEIDQAGDYQQVAFPTANIVGVADTGYHTSMMDGASAPAATAGAVGRLLTPGKIRKGVKLLADGQDDAMGDMPTILYEKQDLMSLLTSKELTDADLTMVKRLENGEINTWMGLRWVQVDPGRLPLVPGETDQWYTAIYYPKYIAYKDRPLVTTRVTERSDKKYRWYAYYESQDFVLRRRDSAVVWIAMERK